MRMHYWLHYWIMFTGYVNESVVLKYTSKSIKQKLQFTFVDKEKKYTSKLHTFFNLNN